MDPAEQKTSGPIFVGPYLDHIQAAETLADLRHYFTHAYRHAVACGDADALHRITAAKDLRKSQLADPAAAAAAPPPPPSLAETDRAARLAHLARIKSMLSTNHPRGKKYAKPV